MNMSKNIKPLEKNTDLPKKSLWKRILYGIVGTLAFQKNKLVSILLWSIIAIYNRHLLQESVVFVSKYSLLVLIPIIIFLLMFKKLKEFEIWWKKVLMLGVIGIIGAGVFYLGIPSYRIVMKRTLFEKLNIHQLSENPETEHERYQTMDAVMAFAKSTASDEVEYPGYIHIVHHEKQEDYQFSIVMMYNSWRQKILQNIEKVYFVSIFDKSPLFDKSTVSEVDFAVGPNLGFSRNTFTAVRRSMGFREFFRSELAKEIIFLKNDDGEVVQVVPIITWKGWLFPHPTLGGVYVIGQQDGCNFITRPLIGAGKFVHLDQMKDYDYLIGQDFLPRRVSRFYANSFDFYKGVDKYALGDYSVRISDNDMQSQPFIKHYNFDRTGVDAKSKQYHHLVLEPDEVEASTHLLSVFMAADGLDRYDVYVYDLKENGVSAAGFSKIPEIGEDAISEDHGASRKGSFKSGVSYTPFNRRYIVDGESKVVPTYITNVMMVDSLGKITASGDPSFVVVEPVSSKSINLGRADQEDWARLIAQNLEYELDTLSKRVNESVMDHFENSDTSDIILNDIIFERDSILVKENLLDSFKRENEKMKNRLDEFLSFKDTSNQGSSKILQDSLK